MDFTELPFAASYVLLVVVAAGKWWAQKDERRLVLDFFASYRAEWPGRTNYL
jgi:hypothetical protein